MRKTIYGLGLTLLTMNVGCAGLTGSGKLSRMDRMKGALVTSMLGDSMGKGTEYVISDRKLKSKIDKCVRETGMSRSRCKKKIIDEMASVEPMKGYFERNITEFLPKKRPKYYYRDQGYEINDSHQSRGTYTDDFEETVATLRSLVETKGKLDTANQAVWIAKQFYKPHGYSSSTTALLKAYIEMSRNDNAYEIRNKFFLKNPAKALRDSNGCSMRAAAIGVTQLDASDADLRKTVYASCEMTHTGPTSKEAAALIVAGMKYAAAKNKDNFNGLEFLDAMLAFNNQEVDKVRGRSRYILGLFDDEIQPILPDLLARGKITSWAKYTMRDVIRESDVELTKEEKRAIENKVMTTFAASTRKVTMDEVKVLKDDALSPTDKAQLKEYLSKIDLKNPIMAASVVRKITDNLVAKSISQGVSDLNRDFIKMNDNIKKVRKFIVDNKDADLNSKEFQDKERDLIRDTIGCGVRNVESLPSALYFSAQYPNDLQRAMNANVEATMEGDGDTVPAKMGSILGALHGVSGIPSVWFEQLYDDGQEWLDHVNYDLENTESLGRKGSDLKRYYGKSRVMKDAEVLHDVL